MTIKIQCPCGVKYAFEVTAESAATPVRFVCPQCGQDSSILVNEIIKQQFAAPQSSASPAPAQPPPDSASTGPRLAPGSAAKPRLRINLANDKGTAAESAPAEAPQEAGATETLSEAPVASSRTASPASIQRCLKHVGEQVVGHCLVCQKPLCPKCMELFGYVCSAYCQAQAEKLRIDIPVYHQQKAVVEARYWRKVRYIALSAVGLVLLLLGAWAWYAHVGSHPKLIYSVGLPGADEQSDTRLIAPDQVLLRYGDQLTRHDLRKKTQVWSTALIDKKQVAEAAREELARQKVQMQKWKTELARLKRTGKLDPDEDKPDADEPVSEADQLQAITHSLERTWISKLKVHVHGSNEIWVVFPRKLTRYNWETGQAEKEIPIPATLEHFEANEQGMFCISGTESGRQIFTRISLPGEQVQSVQGPEPARSMLAELKPATGKALPASTNALPRTRPGAASASPKAVALKTSQAVAARPTSALPAAASLSPRTDGSDEAKADDEFIDLSGERHIFAGENVARLSVKLLEKKLVAYAAMKARPKESALENLSGANATAAMNEIANEWQEERTGGKRQEDESRYQVSIQRLPADGAPEWSGEVIGPPDLFGLKTIDLLVAGKTVIALDKSNKKLWDGKLAYPIARHFEMDRPFWQSEELESAPCLERGLRLYLFDQGVLTAFDLASGAVQWRLPSVGINRLHFDDQDMLYVATTSAGADTLKYSEQVDLSRKIKPVLLKVDPANGKILWRVTQVGERYYFTGKFVYAVETAAGTDVPFFLGGAPTHVRISRLDPKNGRVLWEYYEKRSPLGMDFQKNIFELLYKNELQVFKFLSL